ncbi:hypothetical protein Ahu01nite_090610 [Winogradskya humida]|uniref:Uncharacterized protein n=1 Tax=Winogradskya humida TaxID=113566 RepID=A0ABQ4A5G2_9ACTN|nr:hypothetical protein Ahu01nite_090610 [Actinoplanes humidus]
MQGEAVDLTQDDETVGSGGVRDDRTRRKRTRRGKPRHHAPQRVVGNGKQEKVGGGPGHLVGRKNRGLRQQSPGPLPGRGGHGSGGDDVMPGGGECGTDNGSHPARADNADDKLTRTQLCAHVRIQSSIKGYRSRQVCAELTRS